MGIRGTIGNFPSFLGFYNSDWDIQMRLYEYYEERSGRVPDPTDFWGIGLYKKMRNKGQEGLVDVYKGLKK